MSAPINVLIIGPTQNGKSTLINRLRSISDNAGPKAVVGNGILSQTDGCTVYDISVPMTKYKLVDIDTAVDISIPDDEAKLFEEDGLWDNQDLLVQPVNPDCKRLRLRLIDTPGLDDSRGKHKDMSNISTVLKFLTQISESEDPTHRYISTILFVCNANKAFSADFQEIFKYYKRCMPNLFGSLAIVNTHFSVDKWQQKHASFLPKKLSKKLKHSAKDDVIQERRSSFLEKLDINPQHFFIDSRPRERFPFEELTSRNDLNEIVSFLSFKDPMPITHMRLIKRNPWKAADIRLVEYLNTIKNHWNKERDEILSTASDDVKLRDQSTTRIRDWTAEIARCEEYLEKSDNETIFNLVSYNTKDEINKLNRVVNYATFQKNKGVLKIKEPVTPFFVKTQPRQAGDVAYWTNCTETPTSWTGNYEAKWRKIPSLNAQSYTYNRHYYRDTIAEMAKYRRQLKIDLVQEQEALRMLEKRHRAGESDDPRIKALSTWLSKCETWIEQLKSEEGDLKKGFNASASERYAKGAAAVGPSDLFTMLREDDEDFEVAVRAVRFLLPGGERA